ncbi:MAG: ABC transporter ATP-binding protein [Thermoleophilaceae bacterium]
MPADVTLERVTKRFDDTTAVDGVSLEIERGSFFALLGPSGCGKTTTLRMIGGFEEPTDGRIFLAEREVSRLPSYKRDVNTVFQSYALFPHLSIFENVAFGLRRRGVGKGEVTERVGQALELVDLGAFAKRRPNQLSGGQQQRVALARALVNRPRVLLLDEPLGALDLKLRKQMQLELKGIQHEVGVTFIHVTHDQEEAMTMADQIAVMDDGHVEQLGTPTELYETPRTAFVAGFLGVSNLIEAAVENGQVVAVGGIALHVPPGAVDGRAGAIQIGVRPEKIQLGGDEPNRIPGRIRESAYIGVATQYVVDTDVGVLMVFAQNAQPGSEVAGPGSAVTLTFSPDSTFVLEDAI